MKVYQTSNYEHMCKKAAAILSAQITLHPGSVLGLATGSTPVGVYEILCDSYSRGELDFSEITTFNLDEYCGLPPENPQSYRYFMNTHLFSKVNLDKNRTHLPRGDAENPEKECMLYETSILAAGGIDMQLLGLGVNGHIGFNEPGEYFENETHCTELDDATIKANSRFFDCESKVPRRAITMGTGSIMRAKKVLLIANGEQKSEILKTALRGPITPNVPASILQLHPDLTVVWSPL